MLELVEAAFNQMPFLVDGLVERQFLGPRAMGRDDGLGVDGSDVGAEVIGVEGGIAKNPLHRQAVDQCLGLGDVVALAWREDEAYRQAEPAYSEVDLAGQATATASDRLILRPPFAPAACW